MIDIARMTVSDAKRIAEMEKETFSDAWSETYVKAEIEKDYAIWLKAVKDGETLGYAGVWCVYETAELIRIAVIKKSRRMGVGSALLSAVMSETAARGCERVILEVREDNEAARKLYADHGFCGTGTRKGYYGVADAVIMERKLP